MSDNTEQQKKSNNKTVEKQEINTQAHNWTLRPKNYKEGQYKELSSSEIKSFESQKTEFGEASNTLNTENQTVNSEANQTVIQISDSQLNLQQDQTQSPSYTLSEHYLSANTLTQETFEHKVEKLRNTYANEFGKLINESLEDEKFDVTLIDQISKTNEEEISGFQNIATTSTPISTPISSKQNKPNAKQEIQRMKTRIEQLQRERSNTENKENNFKSEQYKITLASSRPYSPQSESESSNTMTETFSLGAFYKLIPNFDGSEENTEKFITCCDILFETLPDTQKPIFLKYLPTKLTNEAFNFFNLHKDQNWPSLKILFQEKFSDHKSLTHLQNQLTNCKQGNRSIRDYSIEIESILSKMNVASAKIRVNNTDAAAHFRVWNDELATRSFTEGLNEPIKSLIKARDYNQLSTAIDKALEEEVFIKENGKNKDNGIKTCFFCGKEGHITSNCFKRFSVQQKQQSIQNPQYFRNNSRPQFQNFSQNQNFQFRNRNPNFNQQNRPNYQPNFSNFNSQGNYRNPNQFNNPRNQFYQQQNYQNTSSFQNQQNPMPSTSYNSFSNPNETNSRNFVPSNQSVQFTQNPRNANNASANNRNHNFQGNTNTNRNIRKIDEEQNESKNSNYQSEEGDKTDLVQEMI